jgi:hypothetical protein
LDVAESLVDGDLLVTPDAQGFVELAAGPWWMSAIWPKATARDRTSPTLS